MLQNNKKIEHKGIISSIENGHIYVKIIQTTACAGCHAKTLCSLSEAKEKIIVIPSYSENYSVGDTIILSGSTALGLTAVFYAFVVPLILIVAVLALSTLFSNSEILSILFSIGSLILYYIILYLFREKMKNKFVFTLTKKL